MKTEIETQLDQMRQNLDVQPDQIDTGSVIPIFVPSAFFASGKWMGPYLRLRAPEIGLTWSVLFPNQIMRYVGPNMLRSWEDRQLDWKALAMTNLAERTTGHSGIRKMMKKTGELAALVFMFDDGWGPSRLLFRGSLAEQFSQGYKVAIPEMSFGVAYAKDLDGPALATVLSTIDHCYRKGTRLLSPVVYDADDLLPADRDI